MWNMITGLITWFIASGLWWMTAIAAFIIVVLLFCGVSVFGKKN